MTCSAASSITCRSGCSSSLVVAAIVGLVLVLVWLVRRFVPAVREGFDAEVSSQMLGVVAALFGLLFAFIVVIAYQNYGDTQSNVSDEADALAAIVRDSGAFPQPDRDRVRGAVGAYVRAVVDDEWPRMHEGKDSARASAAVDGMYTAIQGFDPSSPRAVSFYDDSVRQLNDRARGPPGPPRRRRRRPALGDRGASPRRLHRHRRLHGSRRFSRASGSTRSAPERSRSSWASRSSCSST